MALIVHISRQMTRADVFCGKPVAKMHNSGPDREIWITQGQERLYPESAICKACLNNR